MFKVYQASDSMLEAMRTRVQYDKLKKGRGDEVGNDIHVGMGVPYNNSVAATQTSVM